ncbi:MAG TPA: YibE/F family protein [Patescibacteria group bacterium]|nr:YibE/F family protein [Patescibacteria group bacterium]
MLKKLVFCLIFFFTLAFSSVSVSHAQLPDQLDFKEAFGKGKIVEVFQPTTQEINGITISSQKYKVEIIEGAEKGKTVIIEQSIDPRLPSQKLNAGDTVVINSKPNPNKTMAYSIYEPYRLNTLLILSILFLLLVILVAGKRGLGAVTGLIVSFGVIGLWIIPSILQGADPLQVSIAGATLILIVTTFVAHGVSLKTTAAIFGTAIALLFAGFLATTVVGLLHIVGLGDENIYNLQVGTPFPINPQGLLLGGIIIGTLGALNDITTTQAITIFTLVRENPKQKLSELFGKGMIIGREHIASLINTLILAYAGSSLAVLIVFELNPAKLPWWVILNNEATMQEIIKSLVGASALILAVPLTTFLACWVALRGTTFRRFFSSFT